MSTIINFLLIPPPSLERRMMHFIGIALKNLERNRRRTVSTILAILIGVSLIVFVNGFNDGLSGSWSRDLIDGVNGHLKLQHKDYKEHVATDLEKILITDPETLRNELLKNPHIVEVMSNVGIMGLVGQEDKSTTFFGNAYDVTRVKKVLPTNDKSVTEGEGLTPDDLTGALLGKMLAESINVKIGDELMILSNSIYSEPTAILINVKGFVSIPGAPEIEQNLLITD